MTPRTNPRARRKRQSRAAFTLIEVMISLGIMTMGALAIITLQQQTIRSNAHARELTTAMQIAQLWAERFKQDATQWNQAAIAGGTPTAATVLASTVYLKSINTAPNVFQLIPTNNAAPLATNAFDFRFNEVVNTDPNTYYCVSFRPAWVSFGRAMRVDVRVWWARTGMTHSAAFLGSVLANFANCNDTNSTSLNPGGNLFNDYHVVYLPTVIRMVTVDI
jgi:type II secretory pathway pseudopilin PulG